MPREGERGKGKKVAWNCWKGSTSRDIGWRFHLTSLLNQTYIYIQKYVCYKYTFIYIFICIKKWYNKYLYIHIYYIYTCICIRCWQVLNFEFVLVSTENWDPQFNQVLGKDSNRDKQANILEQQLVEQGSKSGEKCWKIPCILVVVKVGY